MTESSALPRRTVVRVGISTTALGDSSGDPALRRAIHEELLEDLAVHGRLVFTSQTHLDLFIEAVKSLPTSLAKAWEVVLSSRRVEVGVARPPLSEVLGDILDPAWIDTELADDLELVLVEADQAELLGVADDEFSATTPSGMVEIGRIMTAGRTSVLMAARQVLNAPLRAGVNREVEWTERFGPLVESSKPLVIYDKFVGQQTVRRYLHGQGTGDGLTWFLARVGMKPGRRVRIITAISDTSDRGQRFDEEAMVAGFHRLMDSMGDRDLRLELVLVPEKVRGARGQGVERFGHDRHLRFGERAALALGAGMQTFANATFRETVTVARLPIADAKAREERSRRAALRPPPMGWLG
ncbi:MAG: hypothetical protein OEV20_04575 [Actinomycetota bacterium]|nr:hypothetical protein [Actinomycetota bacterium]